MRQALLLPPCGGGREGGNPGHSENTPVIRKCASPLIAGFPPPLTPPPEGEGDTRAIVGTCEVAP